VPLKDIVGLLLKVRAGAYSIEAANARHEHEWQVWKDVKLPDGKKLIPGVVSHQTNVVEHPELVAERILRFAKVVGRGNVLAGTDCGFAQGPFVRRVHPSIQWAKLQSLAAGARIASQALWPRAAAERKKKAATKTKGDRTSRTNGAPPPAAARTPRALRSRAR
jgi:5-methyltetrahydropteroyltriglutamate--homocysteine methyltransferase